MKRYDYVVLGGGESGVGSALLLARWGCSVLLSEQGTLAAKYREELDTAGIPYEENGHTREFLLGCKTLVKSPGIPSHIPLLEEVRCAGVEVIGEVELAYRCKEPEHKVIAITGSNGKTTTTTWIHHILEGGGEEAVLCGNVGYSFARVVRRSDKQRVYVVEVSSFQLDDAVQFCPDVGVLLTITPDHLDRYGYDFKAYQRSKLRLFMNQGAQHRLVYNVDDDAVCAGVASQAEMVGCCVGYSLHGDKEGVAARYEAGHLVFYEQGDAVYRVPDTALQLEGKHNIGNALAAGLACRMYGLAWDVIGRGLCSFKGLPHRLEFVCERNGVRYVNDSKATNVDAVLSALDSMEEGRVVWIAGGVDKGNDYDALRALVSSRVRVLLCLGVDNAKLVSSFSDCVERVEEFSCMAEVVQCAQRVARAGDTVLLSPACASFDLFTSYEDRGDQFKSRVRELM